MVPMNAFLSQRRGEKPISFVFLGNVQIYFCFCSTKVEAIPSAEQALGSSALHEAHPLHVKDHSLDSRCKSRKLPPACFSPNSQILVPSLKKNLQLYILSFYTRVNWHVRVYIYFLSLKQFFFNQGLFFSCEI